VTDQDYRRALDAAIKEYEALGQQRRDIDDRLAQLAHTMGTLTKLLGLTPTVPMGLTDACRLALRGAGLPLTPLEVRDRLLAIGVDLSIYSNELAAIHTILKRLNDAGEIRVVTKGAGQSGARKYAYIWNYGITSVRITKERAESLRQTGTFHVQAPKQAREKKKLEHT
jgi:hypothetical protein